MVTILLICVTAGLLSALFWVIECLPTYRYLHSMPPTKNPFKMVYRLFNSIAISRWFLIDFGSTVFLAGVFSLGGIIGTAMGLAMSDVISVAVLIGMARSHRCVQAKP